MLIEYTLWPGGMYAIDTPRSIREPWPDLLARFAQHRRVARKQDSPGFGPYRMRAPRVTCYRHRDGQPRSEPHRCDDCVDALTLAVFDADIGDQAAVDACDARLGQAGLSRLWYSSYSHGRDGKCAYRLVLPLSEPVAPSVWPGFRSAVLSAFGIPADPQQCQGRSHYYHMPSCPKGAEPVVLSGSGEPLQVRRFSVQPMPRLDKHYTRVVDDWSPPVEPAEPADLGPLQRRLQQHHERLVRDSADKSKAAWLGRLLSGENIDQHGQRNRAFLCVTGMLAFLTPGQSLGTYQRLIAPCLDASIAAGSSHTWDDDIERMLVGAMRAKYLADKTDAELMARLSGDLAAFTARVQSRTTGGAR